MYKFIIIIIIIILMYYLYAKPRGPTLYDRLGGIYNIAAVVNTFSDRLIDNPVVGKNSPNPQLRDWSNNKLDRLPGLKWMRTLWLCDVSGGPYKYVPTKPGHDNLGLENAHCPLKITPEEFNAVAKELEGTLDYYKVPTKEKSEVLAAFAAHMSEVTRGAHNPGGKCPFS